MKYKFRAFIPDLNIMLYNIDVYANGTIGMTTDKLKLPDGYYIDWDDSCVMQANPDENGSDYHVMNILTGDSYIWFEKGQYNLMQCSGITIGLKELYHGDVCQGFYREQSKDESTWVQFTGVCNHWKGRFEIDFNIKTVLPWDIGTNGSYYWYSPGSLAGRDSYYQIDKIEIVGNVHEHKDLLTPVK